MSQKMKAGIMIDSYKFTIFQRHLTEAGYQFQICKGLTEDTILLKVETDYPKQLESVIEKANDECARMTN